MLLNSRKLQFGRLFMKNMMNTLQRMSLLNLRLLFNPKTKNKSQKEQLHIQKLSILRVISMELSVSSFLLMLSF